jgi:hypothetical protein
MLRKVGKNIYPETYSRNINKIKVKYKLYFNSVYKHYLKNSQKLNKLVVFDDIQKSANKSFFYSNNLDMYSWYRHAFKRRLETVEIIKLVASFRFLVGRRYYWDFPYPFKQPNTIFMLQDNYLSSLSTNLKIILSNLERKKKVTNTLVSDGQFLKFVKNKLNHPDYKQKNIFNPSSPYSFFLKSNPYFFGSNFEIPNPPMYPTILTTFWKNKLLSTNIDSYLNSDYLEINRWLKISDEVKFPARLIKTPLKYTNFNTESFNIDDKFKLFRFRFLEDGDIFQHKNLPHSSYLIYKQKRYQRRDKFKFIKEFLIDNNESLSPTLNNSSWFKDILLVKPGKNVKFSNHDLWLNINKSIFFNLKNYTNSKKKLNYLFELRSNIFEDILNINQPKNENLNLLKKYTKQNTITEINPYLFGNKLIVDNKKQVVLNYRAFRKNKNISETSQNYLNRRLLRTKRTLVLPAHVNIAVITNSFDVVHSWFIPGLGLKLDCIPGRATHHMLHIENVGFYYGQCAEICGRYHHHMPIRICALPFEHFLVWWHSFGLPRMLNIRSKKKLDLSYSFKKYSW